MKTTFTINLALCGPSDVAKEIELAKEVQAGFCIL